MASREYGVTLEHCEEIDRLMSLSKTPETHPNTTVDLDNFPSLVDDTGSDSGCCARRVRKVQQALSHLAKRFRGQLRFGVKVIFYLCYLAYFVYCMNYRFGDEGSIILVVCTVFLFLRLLNQIRLAKGWHFRVPGRIREFSFTKSGHICRLSIRYGLYVVAVAGVVIFLWLKVLRENPENLQSLLGIFLFIFVSFILSSNPSEVRWHPVFWGFMFQMLIAMFTLQTHVGYSIFKWTGDLVKTFIRYSDYGAAFVLVNNFRDYGLAFYVSGILVFFNSVIFLLQHWGVLDFIIIKVGKVMAYFTETGPVETVVAVMNVFIGMMEVPLMITPYLPGLSKSEICAVMTCGFASVSGALLGVFTRFGAPPNHLLTAAVISAPSSLAFTKLICPETESVNYDKQEDIAIRDRTVKRTAISACAEGAAAAVTVVAAVMANMIAFVSMIKLIDGLLAWLGDRAGVSGLSFNVLCSYLLYPVAYCMGAATEDCGKIGTLIGVKLFATPMVGYSELGKLIQNRHLLESYVSVTNGSWYWSGSDIYLDVWNRTLVDGVISRRSEVITTYAMCGFSAFTAIGITLGLLVPLCPEKKDDVISVIIRAFFAANMACFATGAVAGLMNTDDTSTR